MRFANNCILFLCKFFTAFKLFWHSGCINNIGDPPLRAGLMEMSTLGEFATHTWPSRTITTRNTAAAQRHGIVCNQKNVKTSYCCSKQPRSLKGAITCSTTVSWKSLPCHPPHYDRGLGTEAPAKRRPSNICIVWIHPKTLHWCHWLWQHHIHIEMYTRHQSTVYKRV